MAGQRTTMSNSASTYAPPMPSNAPTQWRSIPQPHLYAPPFASSLPSSHNLLMVSSSSDSVTIHHHRDHLLLTKT